MKKKILLLEDDTDLGETITGILETQHYQVDYVKRGNDTIEYSYQNRYDLYIFDINVPDMDGLEILESLRHAEDMTPTIFISAMTDLKTILKGFEAGAYDFIKKPFFLEELVLKVNLKLSDEDKKIVYGDLEYFPSEHKLLKKGEIVTLGEVGLSIFTLFINNFNRLISKNELYESIENSSPTALRFHISNLKKITGLEIKNIRGQGYIVEKT
jgi:DNA-binding response OmpR family regulator